MAKIREAQFNVGINHTPLAYMDAPAPNLQPIASGLSDLAQSFMRVEAEQKQKKDQMQRYQALSSLNDFETESKLRLQQGLDAASPDDTGTAQRLIDSQLKYEQEFVKTLPPDLQPEFQVRADSVRNGVVLDAHAGQDKLNNTYYKQDIKNNQNTAVIDIEKNPDALDKWKKDMDARIDASGLSESEKYFAKQENARLLETAGYGATVKRNKLANVQYTNDLGTAATQAAKQLGISPVDLLTVISYETGGTFNPNIKGGAGGNYLGLIQFGPEEQRKYGVHPGMTVGEQMNSVVAFLQDRGFKPGMSIYDLYSTINAGSPGHYNARDGHNGGAPGTVADKVRTQMDGHRQKAVALLGGQFEIPDTTDTDPRFSNVLYEDRVALQNDATTAVNRELAAMQAERKAAQDTQFNELLNGLNDGRYGAKDIETAREQGWLSDYDQINKAQGIVEQKQKEGADLATFMTRVTRGDSLDPQDTENKKGMNLWFKSDGGEEKLQSMDEGYLTGNLAPTFRATGMLPSDAIGVLGAMTRSADNRKMTYAYKALNTLEEMNPDAYSAQIPEAVRNKADVYDVLRFTMTEPQLFEALRDNPSAEVRRAQVEARDFAKKELDSPDNTKINFAGVLDSFGADQAEVGIKGRVMENEWRSLVLDNASKGMSLEEANNKAIIQLKRKWGNSEIDGVTTLMRNPPEKFYPNMTSQQMTDQLRGELGLQPDEQVQLVSDARTEADIAAGRAPTYIPMILKDGLWTPATGYPEVMSDKKGMLKAGNIDIHDRPMVQNPNGGTSTVDSMSYERDGKQILIPLVSDEGKLMTAEEAIPYWEAKGQNLGVFDTPANADAYAMALHDQQDQQYLQGVRTIKRMYFKPSAADKEVRDRETQIKNLDARINELKRGLPAMATGKITMPGGVANEIEQLRERRNALQTQLDDTKTKQAQQYMTPAQQELQNAQKAFAPLQAEMQSWTDPIEQWPKAKEWETLYDRIELLKRQVEKEVMKKRTSGGVQ